MTNRCLFDGLPCECTENDAGCSRHYQWFELSTDPEDWPEEDEEEDLSDLALSPIGLSYWRF